MDIKKCTPLLVILIFCVTIPFAAAEVEFTFNFSKGWNYFSIPIEEGVSLRELHDECNIQFIYVLETIEEPGKETYELITDLDYHLKPGARYIVYSFKDCTASIRGTPWQLEPVELKANKWHVIGGPFNPTPLQDIIGSCEEGITIIYYDYSKEENRITYPTILEPAKTYFVKSENDCMLYKSGITPPPPTITPPPAGGNSRNAGKYHYREAFLVSDKDWKSVMALVPVGVWTDEGSKIHKYPVLVFHEEGTGFDADSIIYFFQQYKPSRVTIVGKTPQELDNLLVAAPELGAGLGESQLKRIGTSDFIEYWSSYNDVVFVEDNYELSLLASAYASLKNAPLLIEGFNDSIPLENKNVVCIGNIGGQCSERYSLEQLQKKYAAETNTDKVILVNPEDLQINVSEEFRPEKSIKPINRIYGNSSLAAPVLASAKHEIILSTTQESYGGVDRFLKNKIGKLEIDAEYLTIIASPDAIEMTASLRNELSGRTETRNVDYLVFANLDSDRYPELKAGRIFGFSNSDVSSYIARVLFAKEMYSFNNRALVVEGTALNSKYHADSSQFILERSGYKVKRIKGSEQPETRFANNNFLLLSVHSNYQGWVGLWFKLREKNFFPSIVYISGCKICDFSAAKQNHDTKNLACARIIRNSALGFVGFLALGDEGTLSPTLLAFNTGGNDLGTAHKKTIEDFFNPRAVLIGDPTFTPNLKKIDDSFLKSLKPDYRYSVLNKKVSVDIDIPNADFEREMQFYEFPETFRARSYASSHKLEINSLKIPLPINFSSVDYFLLDLEVFGETFSCEWPLQSSQEKADIGTMFLEGSCSIPVPRIEPSCSGFWEECSTDNDCCENLECWKIGTFSKCIDLDWTGTLKLKWYKFKEKEGDHLLISLEYENADSSIYRPKTSVSAHLKIS